MSNRLSRARIVAIAAAAILMTSACSDSSSGTGSHDLISASFDPTSTLELQGPGGASIEPVAVSDIPRLSDAAIEVTVVDVKPSRLNTADGKFPAVDVDGPADQLRGLLVFTEVEVRVEAVHSARSASRDLRVGDTLTIVVDGGVVETILPPDEAAALGVLIPIDEPEGSAEHPDPGDSAREPAAPRTDPGDGVEVAPTEPVSYTTGIVSFYALTEGDRVLLFVAETTQPGFRMADFTVLEPTHPFGIFHRIDGAWVADRNEAVGVDVVALARQVGLGGT